MTGECEVQGREIHDLFLKEVVPVPMNSEFQRLGQPDDPCVLVDVGPITEELDRLEVFGQLIHRNGRRRGDVEQVLARIGHLAGLLLQQPKNLPVRPVLI
ncbi:MAG: hypothetical protein ACK56I_25860, partial [bacterium]